MLVFYDGIELSDMMASLRLALTVIAIDLESQHFGFIGFVYSLHLIRSLSVVQFDVYLQSIAKKAVCFHLMSQ